MTSQKTFRWIAFISLFTFLHATAEARFLQTDPVGYRDQMNLYVYVNNDPINQFDPTGEYSEYVVDEENKTIDVVIPVEFDGAELTDDEKSAITSDIESKVSGTIDDGGKYDGYTINATVEERSRGERNTITVVENEGQSPPSTAIVEGKDVTLQLNPVNRVGRAGHEFGHILGQPRSDERSQVDSLTGLLVGGRNNIMGSGTGFDSKQLQIFLQCRCNVRQN